MKQGGQERQILLSQSWKSDNLMGSNILHFGDTNNIFAYCTYSTINENYIDAQNSNKNIWCTIKLFIKIVKVLLPFTKKYIQNRV